MALNLNNLGGGDSAAKETGTDAKPAEGETRILTRPVPLARQGNRENLLDHQVKPVVQGASSSFDKEIDVENRDQESPAALLAASIGAQDAANSGLVNESNEGNLYSSHPIANYRIGRFRFEKGLLRLNDEDNKDFEKILEKLPATERARVTKLDLAKAEQIVKERLAEGARATKNFDSSTGERAADPLGARIGTGALGDESEAFANTAQTDMNRPVHGVDRETPLSATDAGDSQEASGIAGESGTGE